MKVTGKIDTFGFDYATGKHRLSFFVNEKGTAEELYLSLKEKDKLDIEVKPWRHKRSTNANAYAWELITKIGDVLRASKEEVYITMLKRYGQSELISVKAHIPIAEYVKYCEEAGESELNGQPFKHYRVYKGSSQFDSREMAILIDGIVDEAKALGIQTETPESIENMKSLWRNNHVE